MASFNQIILIGNLGRDPEVKYTQGGQAVCNFSVAVNEQWTDKNGEKQEKTEWFNVGVWGKTAEHCGNYLAKGSCVQIVGRMGSRKYNDKEGVEKTVWEVTASQVTFLDKKPSEGGQGGGGGGGGNRGGSGGGGNRGGSGGGGNRGGGGGGQGGNFDPFEDDPVPF